MSEKSPMRRIYIIDDDSDIRQMLSFILRGEGYETVGQASDGVDIMLKIKAATPAIVLLDINMPGVSGLDILKDIRETYPRIKVIMISGSSSSEDVQKAIKLGASGYVVKPFNTGQVVGNIERAIGTQKKKAAGSRAASVKK